MALMTFKPTSPGRRTMVRVVTPGLHKGAPHAALVEKQGNSGGRNHHGRITTRHIGGGHKQHYRIIDFKRDKEGIAALLGFSRRTQPFAQTFFCSAEMHFCQGAIAQRAQVGIVGPQTRRILLGAPHRYAQRARHTGQQAGVGQNGRAIVDGWHQACLVVHQHKLGFVSVEQHGRVFLSCGCKGRIVAAVAQRRGLCTSRRILNFAGRPQRACLAGAWEVASCSPWL